MNRFFDAEGYTATALAPWTPEALAQPGVSLFKLRDPIYLRSDILGGVLRIEPGYVSDLASIPKEMWAIMSPDDVRIALGAWPHDKLYGNRGAVTVYDIAHPSEWTPTLVGRTVKVSRKDSDAVLAFECMKDLVIPGRNAILSEIDWNGVYHVLRRFGNGWPGDPIAERLIA